MVARTPPKLQRKSVAAAPLLLSPTLLRETVKKVDKCMVRLQELQYAVSGGKKMVSGVSLSPRSTKGYLRTSLRCKQETLRMKNANSRRSPPGKLPVSTEEWQRMSLPAMLLGETMVEILQASQFARNIVEAVSSKPAVDDPKTPVPETRKQQKPNMGNSALCARRKREKQNVLNERSESEASSFQRAKSKINFKVSPKQIKECDKENCRYIATRFSPRNRPWVKKSVLFPNPLFHSSPNSQHHKFCKTKSPVMIRRNRQTTPHKFLIKSPPASSKFQVKIRSPPLSVLQTRTTSSAKRAMPEAAAQTAAKLKRSFSPSRLAHRLMSPLKGRKSVLENEGVKVVGQKQRRPFSPSRIADRLVSPLKCRRSAVQKNNGERVVSGLKQRPMTFSIRFSPRRI